MRRTLNDEHNRRTSRGDEDQKGRQPSSRAQQSSNAHLAIEALRNTVLEESSRVTRNNLVRERAFSERVAELMNAYANSQLTAAEVIADLVALAKDVADEAKRGEDFDPPLAPMSWPSSTPSPTTSRPST